MFCFDYEACFLSKYRFEIPTYICWQATATITATFERVYIRLYIFEIRPLIENLADCKIRSLIRYLSAKGVKAVEIHRIICEVYVQKIEWYANE